MYDKSLVIDALLNIEGALQEISQWTSHVKVVDDFLSSPEGMILLNAVCMKLCAVGEEMKNVDKWSNKTLLPAYSSVNWREVMKMRDVIAHHYFEIDADIVFSTLKNDVPLLLDVVTQIKNDLANNR